MAEQRVAMKVDERAETRVVSMVVRKAVEKV